MSTFSTITCLFFSVAVWTLASGMTPSSKRGTLARLRGDILSRPVVKDKLIPIDDDMNIEIRLKTWTIGVVDFSEVEQSLTTLGYIQVEWTDPLLTWNVSDYQGIDTLVLPAESVWLPKFFVANSAHHDYSKIGDYDRILVRSNGSLAITNVHYFKTLCFLDLTFYPFDEQECGIELTPGDDITFKTTSLFETPDPHLFTGQWQLKDRRISKKSIMGRSVVYIHMTLVRNRLYYWSCIMIPLVISSNMASVVFWIPPETGEKMSFLVSISVSNMVFLNFLGSTMPRAMTTMPRILLFVVWVNIKSLLEMIATVFVLRRYKQEEAEARRAAKKLENSKLMKQKRRRQWASPDDQMSPNYYSDEDTSPTVSDESLPEDEKTISNTNLVFKMVSNIKSDEWDKIFFVLFQFMSIPWLIILFAKL